MTNDIDIIFRYILGITPSSKIDPKTHWILRDDSDGQGVYVKEWNYQEPQPTEAEIVAAEPAAMEAHNKQMLGLYAEEKSLRHGANMIDPNSSTFETVADPTISANEIRQATGRARAKMHNSKARGAEGGNASVVGSKARNNAAQAVEESIGVELVNIELDIFTGAVTTEAEIDARISAIDLTY